MAHLAVEPLQTDGVKSTFDLYNALNASPYLSVQNR
jgi:hypothetical protein